MGGALHFYERGQESHLYDNSTGIVMNFCAILHYNYHSWAITSHLVLPSTSTTMRAGSFPNYRTKALNGLGGVRIQML